MERGLLWLPLLVFFFWMAWSGWNEYRKVETYRTWAGQFERSKYDIYSVLGQKGKNLTWGKPSRSGPTELETFSLIDVKDIQLLASDFSWFDGKKHFPVELEKVPARGSGTIQFFFKNSPDRIEIRFTEIELAAKWTEFLQQELRQN